MFDKKKRYFFWEILLFFCFEFYFIKKKIDIGDCKNKDYSFWIDYYRFVI